MGCILFYLELFLSAYSNSIFATYDPSLCYVRTGIIDNLLMHYLNEKDSTCLIYWALR